MSLGPEHRLLVITPGDGRDLAPWLTALGDAGCRALLLREPGRPPDALAALVVHARAGGFTAIYGHARAPAPGADGLHLPDDGRPPPAGRWGRATHAPADARAALDAGADYALLSPIWSPGSKPGDDRPTLGLDGLRAAGPGPIYALGGLDAARAAAVYAAGGWGVAVLGALFGAATPAEAGRRVRGLLA